MSLEMNDGRTIPDLAFGSGQRRSPGSPPKSTDHILAALQKGFLHLDTAQQYGNEADVGEAIRRSGMPRERLFITTKWSDGEMSAKAACEASLRALGVDYIDLYVIHHTWTCKGDVLGAWEQMEELRDAGLARSIGLSAFGHDEVKTITEHCRTMPVVNMIMFHPGLYRSAGPLLDVMTRHGIVIGAYSCLKPLWAAEDASLMKAVHKVSARRGCAAEQVLIQWCRSKGAVVYTSSTSSERMDTVLRAGSVVLDAEEIQLLEHGV